MLYCIDQMAFQSFVAIDNVLQNSMSKIQSAKFLIRQNIWITRRWISKENKYASPQFLLERIPNF